MLNLRSVVIKDDRENEVFVDFVKTYVDWNGGLFIEVEEDKWALYLKWHDGPDVRDVKNEIERLRKIYC